VCVCACALTQIFRHVLFRPISTLEQ